MDLFSWFRFSEPSLPEWASSHPLLDEHGYWISEARPRLVIYSGAGLSAESGLKTFRGDDGLWEGHSIEEVCNGSRWRDHREKVEAFYEARRLANQVAKPHDGHAFCAEMEACGAVLITQNVDTLLERAGAQHVIHLHGKINERQCFGCGGVWSDHLSNGPCPYCKGTDTRVNVVFFKEPAPNYRLASTILGGLREQDSLVVLGTQATVANPTRWLTRRCNVTIVDPTPSSKLLAWPGVRAFTIPASELRNSWPKIWRPA